MQRYAQSRQCVKERCEESPLSSCDSPRRPLGSSCFGGLVDSTIRAAEETGRIDPLAATAINSCHAELCRRRAGGRPARAGARGLEAGHPLLRMLAELRLFSLAGGSTEAMLRILAEIWPGETRWKRTSRDLPGGARLNA